MFDLSLDIAESNLEPYIQEFHADRVIDLGSMMDALEANDFEVIRRLAHQWKGFCKPCGFNWLGLKSQEILSHAKEESRKALMDDLLLVSQYLDHKKEII
jgi:HPt (histidine-containing phosphotransfer) domain-containing protein